MIVFCSDTCHNSTIVVKCRGVRQYTDSISIVTKAARYRVVPKIDACWISCVVLQCYSRQFCWIHRIYLSKYVHRHIEQCHQTARANCKGQTSHTDSQSQESHWKNAMFVSGQCCVHLRHNWRCCDTFSLALIIVSTRICLLRYWFKSKKNFSWR